MPWRHCFYCGVLMVAAIKNPRRGEQPWWIETLEHVFPRRMIRHEKRTTAWLEKNLVFCCERCNSRKNDMHPLNWLAVMPEHGVAATADLLIDLGVPRRRVAKWLAKRTAASTPGTQPEP